MVPTILPLGLRSRSAFGAPELVITPTPNFSNMYKTAAYLGELYPATSPRFGAVWNSTVGEVAVSFTPEPYHKLLTERGFSPSVLLDVEQIVVLIQNLTAFLPSIVKQGVLHKERVNAEKYNLSPALDLYHDVPE